jgi:hypothetical protein
MKSVFCKIAAAHRAGSPDPLKPAFSLFLSNFAAISGAFDGDPAWFHVGDRAGKNPRAQVGCVDLFVPRVAELFDVTDLWLGEAEQPSDAQAPSEQWTGLGLRKSA